MIKHLTLVTYILLMCLGTLGQYAEADSPGFGKKIVGTYLAIRGDNSDILQLSKDGGLRAIFSIQTEGGALSDPFTDSYGTWEKTGKHEITAKVSNITFNSDDGILVGTALATYHIVFREEFMKAILSCEGAIFAPGVDPLEPDSVPIPGSEFSCSEYEFRRVGR